MLDSIPRSLFMVLFVIDLPMISYFSKVLNLLEQFKHSLLLFMDLESSVIRESNTLVSLFQQLGQYIII